MRMGVRMGMRMGMRMWVPLKSLHGRPRNITLDGAAIPSPMPQPAPPHTAGGVVVPAWDEPRFSAPLQDGLKSHLSGKVFSFNCSLEMAESGLREFARTDGEKVRVHLRQVARCLASSCAIGKDCGGPRILHLRQQRPLVVYVDVRVHLDHPIVVPEPIVADGLVYRGKRAVLVAVVETVAYREELVRYRCQPLPHSRRAEICRILVDHDICVLEHR
mmetsp:Transcript_113547/g.366866  ORF Transcript_113547/g.366866 Transcript_113547/m.366866 type:complete len:217 (-) Transcript_113547:207-857(-)